MAKKNLLKPAQIEKVLKAQRDFLHHYIKGGRRMADMMARVQYAHPGDVCGKDACGSVFYKSLRSALGGQKRLFSTTFYLFGLPVTIGRKCLT